jgi:hypothetical protein
MRQNILTLVAASAAFVCLSGTSALAQSGSAQFPATTAHRFQVKTPPRIVHGNLSTEARRALITRNAATPGIQQLPVWNYQTISTRDGFLYQGVIVGSNPGQRGSGASTNVPMQVVPVVLNFHQIGTSVDLNTGVITTTSGDASSNPTVADTGCFAGSNNVPLTLFAQSPILKSADFNFGGTDVGTAQYTDAFQRANFWTLIDKKNYHVHLNAQVLPTLVVDVPVASGLSLATDVFAPAFTLCSPEGLVDINFLDAVVVNELTQIKGINPGTFPTFMIYNTGMSFGDPTNLNNCCAGGYHSINPAGPLTFQTYSPFDFDVSGFFVPSANDTAIVSHEVAEWMNDPYVINNTPAWGHIGQVSGCQGNLEVADALTGTEAPRIVGQNGFTYHLQELAFFSWFFGNPSLGIHGWDSDNGTFLTDAGPPCQ